MIKAMLRPMMVMTLVKTVTDAQTAPHARPAMPLLARFMRSWNSSSSNSANEAPFAASIVVSVTSRTTLSLATRRISDAMTPMIEVAARMTRRRTSGPRRPDVESSPDSSATITSRRANSWPTAASEVTKLRPIRTIRARRSADHISRNELRSGRR